MSQAASASPSASPAKTRPACPAAIAASAPGHGGAGRVAHAVAPGFGRGERVAQTGLHLLELLLGTGAPGFTLVGDGEAFLDGADQVGIGLFHRLDVEHAALHLSRIIVLLSRRLAA